METCWEGGDLPPNELKSMLSLALAPGVGPVSWHRLVEAFGSAEGVYAAAAAELTAVCPQLRAESLQAILGGPNHKAVRFQEETCQRLRVRIVSMRSDAYPELIRQLPHPPPFLFVAGDCRACDRSAIAVVGTRYPSGYGSRMAKEMGTGLVEAGFTLVSGMARGIDTLAHEAAMAAGGRTLAVLGSGLDWIYPPENVPLAKRIAKHGALITEFPMGTPPHPTHFPRRNRIISSLSLGTLVVEAGNDSGALITADFALDQGREVFAVPGAVHQPGSMGTHKLIREGAHLVERASDILAILEGTSQAVPARRFALPPPAASAPAIAPIARSRPGRPAQEAKPVSLLELPSSETGPMGPAATALEAAAADLDDEARSLLGVLEREPMTLDAIAAKARQAPAPASGGPRLRDAKPHRLLTGLLELELKGRVKRMPGALFRLA